MSISEMEQNKDIEKFLLIRPFIVPLKLFIQRYKEKITQKSQSSKSGIGQKPYYSQDIPKNQNNLDLIRSELKDDGLSTSDIHNQELPSLKKVSSAISARELEQSLIQSQKSIQTEKSDVSGLYDIPKIKKSMSRIKAKDLELETQQLTLEKQSLSVQENDLHQQDFYDDSDENLMEKEEESEFHQRLETRIHVFGELLQQKIDEFDYEKESEPVPDFKLTNPFEEPFRIRASDLEAGMLNSQ